MTTNAMQITLKVKRLDIQIFDQRLGVAGHDKEQLNKFRVQSKNIRLKASVKGLLHKGENAEV